MEMIQHLGVMFLQVGEKVLDILDGNWDYSSFQLDLEKLLNDFGKEICREVMEGADEWLRQHPRERKGWVVQRKNEFKNVLTPFGHMDYQRTYYCNKKTKDYAHLVDLSAGLKPHDKIDLSVKAKLVDKAAEISYCKAGQDVWPLKSTDCCVSGQTVMNVLRRTPLENIQAASKGPKKKIRVLHIQADEDHVHTQAGGTALAKLVYTTSGYGKSFTKRKYLSDVHYTAGLYEDNEKLYNEVFDSIENDYDIDCLEKLYVFGDGAPWIRGLAGYLGAVFLLDKYHINMHIKEELAFCPDLRSRLWKAVNSFDLETTKKVFREAKKAAKTDNERERVNKCRKYLVGNWDGILAWEKEADKVIGCSAEGHVSHVLSARLSSRPMAWAEPGIDKMAKLRAMKANGLSIREYILKQTKPDLGLAKAIQHLIPAQREKLKKVSGEVFDNMPAIQGSNRSLRKALKSISALITDI